MNIVSEKPSINHITMLIIIAGDNVILANFTVFMPGDGENILSMERFKGMLKTVQCTNNSMTISFVDNESYRYAQRHWDWVNGADNHSFVMVASKGDCGDNPYRIPYLVHTINYNDATKIAYLNAERTEWSKVAHSFRLHAGTLTEDSGGGLVRRQHLAKDISLNTDFRFKNKAKFGPMSIELRCDPCYIQGSIGFEFDVLWENFLPTDIQFKTAPKGVSAEAGINVIIASDEKKDLIKPRFNIGTFPLPGGISIPGNILTLGPSLQIEYGADITGQLALSFGTGATAKIPDSAILQVNLLDPDKNKFSSWTPQLDMHPIKFDKNQIRASVKFQQFIELSLALGAQVFGNGIEAKLALKMPYVETKAELILSDRPGICGPDDKGDVAVKITNSYGVELKFVTEKKFPGKGNTEYPIEVSLAAGNYPLGQPFCHSWDVPGQPKVSGSPTGGGSSPSSLPSSGPGGKSCTVGTTGASGTCQNKNTCTSSGKTPVPGWCPNDPADVQCCVGSSTPSTPNSKSCTVGTTGASGTCQNKNTCSSSGKTPVPGWCPNDPADVQCCVEYHGGNTCYVGSGSGRKIGTCLSTTLCKDSGGVATAGLCVDDPVGIQCCTSMVKPGSGSAGGGGRNIPVV